MDSIPYPEVNTPEPRTDRPRFLAVRLSVQMFLAFAVQGAWVPIFSVFLKELDFTPAAVAWAFAAYSLSSLVAPLVWGQIADRWVPAERCISWCAMINVAILWYVPSLRQPAAMFVACVLFWFFMIPVNSLGTALTLRQLEHPERSFGRVRLWGTIGWVFACVLLTIWLREVMPALGVAAAEPVYADSFRLAALFAALLSGYSLTLPSTPPAPVVRALEAPSEGLRRLHRLIDAPMLAIRLLRRRVFLTYSLCVFGFYLTYPFVSQMTPLLLEDLGIQRDLLPTVTTVAQTTEVATLALLPWLLRRVGTRATMVLGIGSWTLGVTVYAIGRPTELVVAALATQGLFIGCFLVAGQMFVNRQSLPDVRASAQGLMVLIGGAGLLLGHFLVGWVRVLTADHFSLAFLPAAIASGILIMVFVRGTTPARGAIAASETLVSSREIT
jgi:MFS family permease